MNLHTHYFIFIIIFSFSSFSALARSYDVEIIIFDKKKPAIENQKELNGEQRLSEIKQEKYLNKLAKLNAKKTIGIFPIELPINTLTQPKWKTIELKQIRYLAKIHKDLIKSGYNILLDAKWLQPSSVYQHTPVISLSDLNSVIRQAYIRIYKTSLIFVNIDIEYQSEDQPKETTANFYLIDPLFMDKKNLESMGLLEKRIVPPRSFISEKRRLKFKEVHYFDNPQFGVILGVWPG